MDYKSIASYLPHSGEMVLVDEIIEVGADYIITRTEIAKHAIFCETSALGMQFRTCENFGDFADSKSSLNPQNSHKYKSHTANLGSLEKDFLDSSDSRKFCDSSLRGSLSDSENNEAIQQDSNIFCHFERSEKSFNLGESKNSKTHPLTPSAREGEKLECGASPQPPLTFVKSKQKTFGLRDLSNSSKSAQTLCEDFNRKNPLNPKNYDSRESKRFLPTFSKWAWVAPIKNNPSIPFLKGGGGVNPQESKNSRESQKLGEMPIDLRKSGESKRFFAYAQNDKILDSRKSKKPITFHESTFADFGNDSEASQILTFPTYKTIELMAQSLGIFRALNERGSGSKLGFLLGARRFEIFAPYIKKCAFTKATISMQSADGLGVYDCEIFEGAISQENLIARASISALNPSAEFLAQIKGEV